MSKAPGRALASAKLVASLSNPCGRPVEMSQTLQTCERINAFETCEVRQPGTQLDGERPNEPWLHRKCSDNCGTKRMLPPKNPRNCQNDIDSVDDTCASPTLGLCTNQSIRVIEPYLLLLNRLNPRKGTDSLF